MDWNGLILNSLYHGTTPRVYASLSDADRREVPPPVLSLLKSSYDAASVRNTTLWNEFLRVHSALTDAGISILPLKGIELARSLYPDPALRPMNDIDVLLAEHAIPDAMALLEKMGYAPDLDNLSYTYWRRFQCHIRLRHASSGIILELHWLFAPARPFRPDISECWKRARVLELDGNYIPCLSREDMLLSLCLHLGRNISSLRALRLRQLYDIHELLTRHGTSLDTGYIIRKAREWKIRSLLVFIAGLTSGHLGTVWPEGFSFPPIPPTRPLQQLSHLKAQALLFALQDSMGERLHLIWLALCMALYRNMRQIKTGIPIR